MASSSDRHPDTKRELLVSYARTSVFCLAIGITIWLIGLSEPLWAAFAVSFAIGYAINTASVLLHPLLMDHLPPLVALTLTTLVGIGTGVALGGLLVSGDPLLLFSSYYTVVLALFFGVLGLLYFTTRERLSEARTALAQARADQLGREKAHLETQLRLLQAQIEPHFLFNTLSNVIGMIRDQPEAAEKTLTDLTRLLRASLKRTRAEHVTLDDELTILKALLEIHQIRMGNRLHWSVEVTDDALLTLMLPPMLLQPLVENALQHGIEPLEQGGSVSVRIHREGERLVARVADTGAGPPAAAGYPSSGVGLANVQSRLVALFGREASLELTENQPHGMVATLSVPVTRP